MIENSYMALAFFQKANGYSSQGHNHMIGSPEVHPLELWQSIAFTKGRKELPIFIV